jgi:O-antigen ligase
MNSIRREQLAWWLWIVLLVSLPITSFPPISEAFGRSTVAPMAIIPLIGLLAIAIVPALVRKRELPQMAVPVLVFLGCAVLSAAVGLFHPLASFKGQTPLGREFRALITLAVGVGFFMSAALMPVSVRRMRMSLIALTIGGAIALLWSIVQAAFFLQNDPDVFRLFNELHRVISIRDLVPDRVSGLAYEPSWFGNQIVVLYLPIWMASVALGYSSFKWKWRFFTIELGLAVLAVVTLLLARTRVSVFSFSLILGVLIVSFFWRLGGRVSRRTSSRLPFRQLAVATIGLIFVASIGTGILAAAREFDPRFQRAATILNELPQIRSEHPYELGLEVANRTAFAERVVYWMAAWQVFLEYPLTGIGPGNSGFLFEQSIPAYGHRLTEIQTALSADSPIFPNPKSLWIRLLAETGILGFASFVTWQIVVLAGALSLRTAKGLMLSALGLAGLLSALALVIEGFNLDTFALPQMWIVPGLVTAGILLHRRSKQEE